MSNIENEINFKCQGSSNCCISHGSYGYVYLTKNDIINLSDYFKISVKNFKKKYCNNSEGYIFLKDKYKNKCIFLKNKRCTVYKIRPTQCKTFPFWPENMNTKTWNKDIMNFCPGIGKGKKFSKDEIKKILEIDKLNEKKIKKERINSQ